jgi:hypothetical protein
VDVLLDVGGATADSAAAGNAAAAAVAVAVDADTAGTLRLSIPFLF